MEECLSSFFPEKSKNLIQYQSGANPVYSSQEYVLFSILENDNADSLIAFLQANPKFDINSSQNLNKGSYYFDLFDCQDSIKLIDFCFLFGALNCFKILLLNNCTIRLENLRWSIAGGNKELINILKEKNHPFEYYLITSVKYHRYDLMEWINQNYKCTPVLLPTCVQLYNFQAFNYFFNGTYIDQEDWAKRTSLHFAVNMGWFSMIEYLLVKGANINAMNRYRWTPLHCAVKECSLPIVELLISKGANIEVRNNLNNQPIHIACDQDYLQIVKYFIEHTDTPIDVPGYGQMTPLHIACEKGSYQMVEYLISKGADIERKDAHGFTAIVYACLKGHLSIVKLLAEKGADIYIRTRDGATLLHLSAHIPVIQYLVDKGLDVNAICGDSQTPLHWAVRSSHINLDLIKFLLSKGADKNAKDDLGRTPYDYIYYKVNCQELKRIIKPDSTCFIA